MSFITPWTETSRVMIVVNVRSSAYTQPRSTRGSTPRRRCRVAATRSRPISTNEATIVRVAWPGRMKYPK